MSIVDVVLGIKFCSEPGKRLFPAVLRSGLLGGFNGVVSPRLLCGFPRPSRAGGGCDRRGKENFGLGDILRNCINKRPNGNNRLAYCYRVEGGYVKVERVGSWALVPHCTIDGEYADRMRCWEKLAHNLRRTGFGGPEGWLWAGNYSLQRGGNRPGQGRPGVRCKRYTRGWGAQGVTLGSVTRLITKVSS